jgi:hypothetical protein
MAQQAPVGQGLLIIEASRSHSDPPHSVRLFWTSDQPDAETSTWQHTALTRDRHPCPRVRFEPAIPASERPQTHTLDRAATGVGTALQESLIFNYFKFVWTYLSPLPASLSLSLSLSLSFKLSRTFINSVCFPLRSMLRKVLLLFDTQLNRESGHYQYESSSHQDCRTDVTKQNTGH